VSSEPFGHGPAGAVRALAMQNTVLTALIESPSVAEATPRILGSICHTLDLEAGAFWRKEDASGTLHCVGSWARDSAAGRAFLSDIRDRSLGRGEAWGQGPARHLPEVATHSDVAVPVLAQGRVLGVIEGYGSTTTADPDLLEAVEFVGRQVGLALLREDTERASAELAIRLSTLIHNLHAGTVVENEARRIAIVNQGFCDLFGLPVSPEALIGADCAAAAEAVKGLFADPPAFVAANTRAVEGRRAYQGEVLELADGRIWERDYAPIVLDGRLTGHLWTYRDVTASRQLELQNAHLRGFYEQVLEAVPAQVAVFDLDGRFLYVNSASISNPEVRRWVIGRTNEDYCRERGVSISVGEERSRNIRSVAREGRLRYLEESFVRHGEVRSFGRFMSPVFDADGNVVQVVGFGHDLTEMKQAAAALEASEARLRGILESALDCVVTIDADGNILEFSPAAERAFGYTRAEVLGQPMADCIVPERLREAHRRGIQHYLATGEGPVLRRRIEVPAMRADGSEFPAELAITPVPLAEGQQIFTAFLRDITERKKGERELRESEERLRLVLEAAELGTWDLDIPSGTSTLNDGYMEMLGYAPGEVAPVFSSIQEWTAFLHPDDALGVSLAVEAHLRGETELYESEHRMRHSSGDWIWVLDRGRVLERDADGRPLRACGTHLDITARKRAEAEAHTARLAAERAAAAREQFLANISHELRTPLNAIVGLAHLLDKTQLDSEQGRFLQGIRFAADALLGVINDLLDFSRVQSGRISFEAVPFEPRLLLQGLAGSLLPGAQARGLTLGVEVAPDVPKVVVGDPGRLNQVLLNLVGNAVKFTEKGGVAVRVTATPIEQDLVSLEFLVSDTGIGIAPADQERIFEAFQQAHPETNRRFGGSGLGLAIVREMVRQQGGRATLESALGTGSTFRVTLPFRVSNVSAQSAPAAAATVSLAGRRILLAEDNELNRTVATQILQQAGAVVVCARDGREALERVRSEFFDLVLMDIQMPEMDGYEATWRIRHEVGIPAELLPVVALTATALTDEQRRAEAAGMSDCILKPFPPDQLCMRVAALLPDASPGSGRGPAIDVRILEANTLHMPDFTREVLEIFLRSVPDQLDRMRIASNSGDWTAVGALAHALKSQAGTIGAVSFQEAAAELERTVKESKVADRLSEHAGGAAGASPLSKRVGAAALLGRWAVFDAARLAADRG
jgi:PAS domain S-box-containing protein